MERDYTVVGPDGREFVITGPENASPQQLRAAAERAFTALPKSKTQTNEVGDFIASELTAPLRRVRDLGAGAIRGAGSIGATMIRPFESAEANASRRQGIDEGLRSLLGADPQSGAYAIGKLGGEIAGTAGLGPALAGGARFAGAAPGIVNALSTAGMTAPSIAARIGGGAVTGGAAAALVNPGDAAMGAAVGGALPPVLQGAGAAGRFLGSALTKGGGQRAAVERVASELGGGVNQAIGDLQTYYPKGAENIPVSAAGIVGNPNLTRLEQASRIRSAPAWQNFDDLQSGAVAANVQKATREADELAARMAQRQENWGANWAKAEANKQPRNFKSLMGQLKGALDSAAVSAESSNPAVLNLLKAVDGEVSRLGKNFDIGHLQQIRANLNGKANPTSPDAFKAAPRESAAVRTLIQELDSILNQSTKGQWDKVRGGYADDSVSVHQAKAAQKVRDAFIDPSTGRVRGVSRDTAGDIPSITEAGLGRAMDAARLPDKSLALSQGAEQQLSATLDALRKQAAVQKLNRAATGGGGSATASNAFALGARQVGGNRVLEWLDAIGSLRNARTDQAMANLLQSPDELANLLSQYVAVKPANPMASIGYRAAPLLNPWAAR